MNHLSSDHPWTNSPEFVDLSAPFVAEPQAPAKSLAELQQDATSLPALKCAAMRQNFQNLHLPHAELEQ